MSNPERSSDHAVSSQAGSTQASSTEATLAELDQLIGELKDKVSTLRDGEFDASALEGRLRELTDLASRAASALDSVSR